MLIDYVNNYAITILYITILILWNILSFSGAFSLKEKHEEKYHVHESKRAILSAEWKFSLQTWQQSFWEADCLVSLFIGQIITVLLMVFYC